MPVIVITRPINPPNPNSKQHGPGAVLGYSCLLTGAPEDWYAPRAKRGALLRLEAQTESWVLQIPHAFVDQAIKHHPFPTLALAARKARPSVRSFVRFFRARKCFILGEP